LNVEGNRISEENLQLIKKNIQNNQKTVIVLYVFNAIKSYAERPSLPALPLDVFYYIATFLLKKESALKLSQFAGPRFFVPQIITSNPDEGHHALIEDNTEEQAKKGGLIKS